MERMTLTDAHKEVAEMLARLEQIEHDIGMEENDHQQTLCFDDALNGLSRLKRYLWLEDDKE